MTPAARIAAAIEILDRMLAGAPAEAALTGWARGNRFAGSGDRASIRDHVFDVLRRRRSCAWCGGAETGRGLMLGALRMAGTDPDTLFTGARFAPPPLTPAERAVPPLEDAPEAVRLDCPDWLLPLLRGSLGARTEPVLARLRDRAPVFLRANAARTTRDAARAALASEGIETRPHDLSPWALEVTANPRRVQMSNAFRAGLVELQDAASQALCAALPAGGRALDYCAGGGGKALALVAAGARVFAHDANPARMRDLPARAARAGARIEVLDGADLPGRAPFDLVLCDAPCSGSGTWRRTPETKWNFSPQRLGQLREIQSDILSRAAPLVAPGGVLAYATCSLLEAENAAQAAAFAAHHPGWVPAATRSLTPLDGGDGFYWALFRAPPSGGRQA